MATSKATQRAGLTWEEVCNDPHLQNLPYQIELNEWGQIVMTPTHLWHGAYQFEIGRLIGEILREGEIVTEAAIQTAKGTKVADVAWFSDERWEQVKEAYDAPIAPEICVEVVSPSNAPGEIDEKRALYYEAGADEVWLCNKEGEMTFYDKDGTIESSRRVPSFPSRIEV